MRPSALLLCFCTALSIVGCGDGNDSAGDAGPDAGLADSGPLVYDRIPEAEAEAGRESCAFDRGAMPWETIGEPWPIGDDIPIDHVILVMQENRSFDHYFGAMPGIDGFPDGWTNPDASGAPVAPYHETAYCIRDVAHSWNASHVQYGDGANDGFVVSNDPGGERALGYFTGDDLPFYWDLYSTFAMSDKHFCSVLGPTWVNRFYYMGGSSRGLTSNRDIPVERLENPHNVFQLLDDRGIDWRLYNSDLPTILGLYPRYAGRELSRIRSIDRFWEDVAAGELPPVVYVEPSFTVGVEQTDEHPPANPQAGQKFISDIYEAVTTSPLWARTALIVTYDEHGGFADHVPPPEACVPDEYEPDLEEGDQPGGFDRLGFRVPLVVISPYSKPGYVSDRTTDLTSVLRFVQARFLLPALSARDANAWPLLDMFDFSAPAFLTPPTLAEAIIDEAKMDACREAFPDSGVGGF